jgi:hypothetical protein
MGSVIPGVAISETGRNVSALKRQMENTAMA